jgi:hypothetical protein
VITDVTFARYGTPKGVCTSLSSSAVNVLEASDRCDAGNYVRQYFTAKCVGRSSCGATATNDLFGDPCPGTAKWLTVDATCGTREDIGKKKVVALEPPPMKYVDAIVSQALTDYCSININTPFRLRIRTGYNLPGSIGYTMDLGGKPRAYVSKAPGFLFSSYQILAQNAPLLVGVDSFTNIAFKAYDLAQNFQSTPTTDESLLANSGAASLSTLNASSAVNKTQERLEVLSRVGKNPFLTPVDVPKQRLLIKMKENSTMLEKAILINNLMAKSGSGVTSQFSSLVTDTKGIIAETEVATTALNFFLVRFRFLSIPLDFYSLFCCWLFFFLVFLTHFFCQCFIFLLFFFFVSSFSLFLNLKHRFSFQSSS